MVSTNVGPLAGVSSSRAGAATLVIRIRNPSGTRSGQEEGEAAMSEESGDTEPLLRELRFRAIDRLRAAYDDVYHLSKIPLTLLNERKDASAEYHSVQEYTRELLARANAIGGFAVDIGILEPFDQLDAMYEFCDKYPECAPKGWEAGKQRSALRQRRGTEPE
jgi:hypothetical protein